jgi:hypothetical protein
MRLNHPLISKDGFSFLSSVLDGRHSKAIISQLFSSLVEPTSARRYVLKDVALRRMRKDIQYNGVLSLIKRCGEYFNILEIGSGDGGLVKRLATEFPNTSIVGIEINPTLATKSKNRLQVAENINFVEADAFSYTPTNRHDLVLSLHGCGNLTDRVIDIAIQLSSDVICIPCCYGKVKRKEDDAGSYFLPRSRSLLDKEDFFRRVVARRAAKLEGAVDDAKQTIGNILREAYRILFDFDRTLYLKEKGYNVAFVHITTRYFESQGKRHANSSLNRAIVGIAN